MAQPTSALVDYESTSEEDNFSDCEWPGRPESLLLPMPRWPSNVSLSSDLQSSTSSGSESDFQLDHGGYDPSPPQGLTVSSSAQEEAQKRPTPFSDWPQEELDQDSSAGDDSEPSASQVEQGRLLEESWTVEDTPAVKRPRLQTSSRGAQGRGAYALKPEQLEPELRELLHRSRAFFTKPHSLQRSGGPVTLSTYGKAEERILCKFLL